VAHNSFNQDRAREAARTDVGRGKLPEDDVMNDLDDMMDDVMGNDSRGRSNERDSAKTNASGAAPNVKIM